MYFRALCERNAILMKAVRGEENSFENERFLSSGKYETMPQLVDQLFACLAVSLKSHAFFDGGGFGVAQRL